ncbi:zinc-ribbon domain-containing protein, partial [Oscillochloris sp. ZM17-4]|uniref:zinc-ribbon domain-containing protein n=1 Tax=Oscillochloris sp. ZM17-4 TaxID=2866714 RepID=UPI001C73B75C
MPGAFCPHCGARLAELRRFCPECGAALAAPAPAPTNRRLIWAILGGGGCLGALMLLACAGLLLLTLGGGMAGAPAPP